MKEERFKNLLSTTSWVLVLFTLVLFAGVARSEFPEKPLTLIIGFEPGGPVDIVNRALAAGASGVLKQNIVIENKGGGGGTVALGVLAAAKPDGYTLCALASSALINTPLMQKVPFKPLKSFTPIISHSTSEHTALLVKSDARWKTFDEFLEYASKNPGKIKYSTAGVGTPMHVAMEFIAHKAGIRWVHVPYKGQAPARTALIGGHVDACSSGADWVPYAQSGAVRALATYGRKRSPSFPNVPTIDEHGYDFESGSIYVILGPAGLPPNVVQKLEIAFTKGAETTEFKRAQETFYLTPIYYDSRGCDRYLKEQWEKSEKVFKDTAIIKEAATQPY